ncbi:putative RNA-directed DNA polymerase, eukaryota, reverse transcriptase zinc-binding domain protein [Tanacetum coccineum]
MKHLKSNIQLWARKFNASKSEEKVQLSSKIGDIERELEAGLGSSSLHSRRKDLLLKLRDIECAESLDAYQKAKIKWGIEANENTKFFHGIVKKKRRDLAINGVMKNGIWFSDPGDIKDIFREFFVEKFKHFEGVDVTRRSDHYKTLSSAQASLLEHSISEHEVYDAIRDCGSEKSPGLDGFSFAFYKKYWDILKIDIMAYVREFFKNGNIHSGCNSSFITLIPKVDNPLVVSDFRPISLIGAQNKILAKILANRLSRVIDFVISPEQTAFIKSRQILDGPLMLNEIINWYKKRKQSLMIFKVDFEKAFDSVSWDFLDRIMGFMGFGCR